MSRPSARRWRCCDRVRTWTRCREIFTRMLDHDDANRYLTGADVRYDLGSAQDLVGRCYAPDTAVRTPGGEVRLADLQRSGRGVLVAADEAHAAVAAGWAGRVDVVAGTSGLAPGASILVRADGSSRGRPATRHRWRTR
ncbi:hypothetical protein [Actinomadura verrucosospora]|nr:hypothetical protein [Actinomadura verrucosospora]